VSAKVQAFVAAMRVDNDQHVRAGDTLVLLDDRDLRARLRQAEADLANAEAAAGTDGHAGQARAQLASSQAQAASAQAAIVAAEAAFTKAAVDLERIPRPGRNEDHLRASSSMPPRRHMTARRPRWRRARKRARSAEAR
jgi:multidrug resistance efflux pump